MALQLDDLKKISSLLLFEASERNTPWSFAAIGPRESSSLRLGEFLISIERDLEWAIQFNDFGRGASAKRRISAYETKLPDSLVTEKDTLKLKEALLSIHGVFLLYQHAAIQPYFEIDLRSARHNMEFITAQLSDWGKSGTSSGLRPGVKVRTAGESTPSTEELSEVLRLIGVNALKFKATQGLHHPVTKAGEWGFVNLFGALSFAVACGDSQFGKDEIKRCLEDEDPNHFVFGPKDFSWRNFNIECEEIESARGIHQGCFGSCSVDEPDSFLSEVFPT
jgi:hypothetical protein